MNTREALSIAGQVKNRYKAFERLEEALSVAANLESTTAKLQADYEARMKDRAALEDTIISLADDVKKARADTKEKISKANSEMVAKREKLAQEYQAEKDELDSQLAGVKAKTQEAQKEYTDLIAEKQKTVAALTEAESRLRRSIENLKSRVEKVEV